MTPRPSFFIVGAPKSATTSLKRYLGEHPAIFMPDRGEMHYFGSDLRLRGPERTQDWYLSHFAAARADQTCGEKSVFYLSSETAAAEIADFRPDARILILLRNPVDMIASMHRQFLHSGNEDLLDLADALEAEPDRAAGRRIPRGAHNPHGLRYRHVADYATHVEAYLRHFGRDRIRVLLFDDLVADPRTVYKGVLAFLGVADDGRERFEAHNTAKQIPSLPVRDLVRRHPHLKQVVHHPVMSVVKQRARALTTRWQRQPPREIDPGLRRRLLHDCEAGIHRLAALIDRDLGAWLHADGRTAS